MTLNPAAGGSFTAAERAAFRLGFLFGGSHGLDLSQQSIREVSGSRGGREASAPGDEVAQEDGAAMIQHDPQYEEYILTEVRQDKDGWEILHDSMVFFMPNCGIVPKAGDVARFYGKGFGYSVRGLTINGEVAFYRTEAEEEQKREREQIESDAKRREEFETNRASTDATYAGLPVEFQRRLDRFRGNNPDFRWRHEPYELFCCTEALKIARQLESADAVAEFGKKSLAEQQVAVPAISGDHSGNTFGMAVRLAWLYIAHPELVEQEHGALCPLVGCVAYGCHRPKGM